MGTAAWGGWGEGKCFHCNGLSWCGCHLQCPSLLHQTAVPPKLLGVLIIRLCGRTAQPSATPASPHVSMRGMINPALHSASPKETSRWCVATQPRESHVWKTQQIHLHQKPTTRKTGRLLTWARNVTAGAKRTATKQQKWTRLILRNTVLPLLQHPKYNIPKEILMAVASRESRAGSLLGLGDNKPGYGDHNNGFGLMQVDIRYHPVANEKNIDNIDLGAGILADMLKKVKEKHPDWSEGWQLRGAVAAYNFGLKNVQTKSGIDVGTASTCKPCDGNYSWDTMQRARWLAFN